MTASSSKSKSKSMNLVMSLSMSSSSIQRDNNNNSSSSPRTSNSKKSLRFRPQDELCQVLLIETIAELNVRDIWFASDDYFDMKAKTRYDAKEWRKQGYGILLKETFENPADNTQDYLNAFCLLDGQLSRRGMERHLCRYHGEERSDLKDRARYCVLSNQRRMKRQGLEGDELTNHLAFVYHEASKPSKLFARRIAKADESAAGVACNNQPALALFDLHGVSPGRRKMERRLSNASNMSSRSGSTFDSLRSWTLAFHAEPQSHTAILRKPTHILHSPALGSPATAMEECYAAMA
jgi:hypothetical protein